MSNLDYKSYKQFESGQKIFFKKAINNVSYILAAFAIIFLMTVIYTRMDLGGVIDSDFYIKLILILLSYDIMYLSMRHSGRDNGAQEKIYINTAEIFERTETYIRKKLLSLLNEWCPKYLKAELETAKTNELTKVGITYDEYLEKYADMEAKEIIKLPLKSRKKKAIIKANKMRELKLTVDMLLSSNNGGSSRRHPLGLTDSQMSFINAANCFIPKTIFGIFSASVVIQMMIDPSAGTIIYGFMNLFAIIIMGVKGYDHGYRNKAEDSVKYMKRQMNYLYIFKLWCEKEKDIVWEIAEEKQEAPQNAISEYEEAAKKMDEKIKGVIATGVK